ncbi:hypothetical protein VKT23_002789 [Stygiomarasmius scandens]|uniref:Uncharacterized protein n=1 Tax=Marasmiellus scandens TaxID=2682957 RepID=A0ABR1JW32_9AGAR
MVLAWLFFFVSAFSGVSSNSIPRAATTEATCTQGYSWTMNAQNQSPCQLAVAVMAPCSPNGNWNLPSLTESNHYNGPSTVDNTVNSCSCSWAAYNLLSACTVCQGLESDSIITWFYFTQNCGSKVSQEDFYTSGGIEVDVAIPYYATQNPKNWTDGKFDVAQAQQIQGQDVNLAERPVSSTSTASPTVTVSTDSGHVSIGAIAGGTVVGFVVVCVGAALVIYYLCRRRRSRPQAAGEDQDHLLARESPSRPETIVSPFPWSLSPPPSMPPSREKSPPISMTETNTRSVSRSNTSRVSSSRSTSRASHTHVATFTVEEDVALDPVSLLPIPQTNPPPYRHTPEVTPAFLQFLTSPGAAPSHEDYHCSSLHRPQGMDISSTWDSLGSRAEMIDSSFASVSRTSSPPFHGSLVSPRLERPYPTVRFGTSNDGHIDEDDLVHRIA